MQSIVVVSGVGAHSDPWHALPATSARVAEVLAPLGEVRVVATDDPALTGEIAASDVVVVNVSGDLAAPPADSRALVDALEEHSAAGRGIVALHSSSLAFGDDPRWAALLGGRWVPGTTMHPQIGHAVVQATDAGRDLLDGLDDFVLYDERYTALETRADARVLAEHTEDGMTHPLVWGRERDERDAERGTARASGRGRVAYDALGHGVESFDSPEHRRLVTGLVVRAAEPV